MQPAPRRVALLVLPLLAALILSLLALLLTFRVVVRLPDVAVFRVSGSPAADQATQTVLADVLRNAPQARDGLQLVNWSQRFTDASRSGDPAPLEASIAEGIGRLGHSGFARLQLLAARLLQQERAGQPPQAWAATARPILDSIPLDGAPTYQASLQRAVAQAFAARGLRPGVAALLAQSDIRHPHGPLLQFVAERVGRCADALPADDGETAAALRRGLVRALRPLVLDEGPAGLRLLAADLLADLLPAAPPLSPSVSNRDVVDALTRWTARYRAAAAARPPGAIGGGSEAFAAPREHARFATWLGLLAWALGSTGALSIAALAALPFAGPRESRPVPLPTFCRSGAVAAALIAGGWLCIAMAEPWVLSDLRQANAGGLPGLKTAGAAAGLALAALLISVAAARPRQATPKAPESRPSRSGQTPVSKPTARGRFACTAAWAWLLTALSACVAAGLTSAAQARLDAALLASAEDSIASVAGADHAALLAPLHQTAP